MKNIFHIILKLLLNFFLLIVFYLFVSVCALISRIFGKRYLELEYDYSINSYWIDKNKNPSNGDTKVTLYLINIIKFMYTIIKPTRFNNKNTKDPEDIYPLW